MEKPKLSICMIVKNEEANLQRCLDSFLPIIQMKDDKTLKPLTELIILDTGSTDRTINIAKKFTDKVYKKNLSWTSHYKFASSTLCEQLKICKPILALQQFLIILIFINIF